MRRVADPGQVIAAARAWIGTPYHDQASLKGVGCDCLGLVRGVWREVVGAEPISLPPYSRAWDEVAPRDRMLEVARACMIAADPVPGPPPGAVLVFRMRPRAAAKHMAILTDAGSFIHSYERLGVVEQPFTRSWARKLAGAFLMPASWPEGGR